MTKKCVSRKMHHSQLIIKIKKFYVEVSFEILRMKYLKQDFEVENNDEKIIWIGKHDDASIETFL